MGAAAVVARRGNVRTAHRVGWWRWSTWVSLAQKRMPRADCGAVLLNYDEPREPRAGEERCGACWPWWVP